MGRSTSKQPRDSLAIPTTDLVSFAFDVQTSYDEDKPIYISAHSPAVSLSAVQTRDLVQKLVAGFQNAGLQKGNVVLLCVGNSYLYIALLLGIIGAGGVCCGVNPAFQLHELSHIAQLANPKYIIANENAIPLILQVCKAAQLPRHHVLVLDELSNPLDTYAADSSNRVGFGVKGSAPDLVGRVSDLLNSGKSDWCTLRDEAAMKGTPAIYYPTSGTTGLPKLAVQSHYSLIFQHLCLYESTPYTPVRLACLPFFHIFGASWAIFTPLRYGQKTYIMPRFSLDSYVDYIREYSITETYMAPPMVHALNRCTLPLQQTLSTLRYVGIGGAPIDATALRKLRSHLHSEANVTQVWGMTEFGVGALFRWTEQDDTGSIGRLLPGYEMKLVNDTGRVITEEDRPGEILIRTGGLMSGYLKMDGAGDAAWLPTGDLARVRDGKIYVVGRLKEIIKVKGWQVAPAELEAVMLEHPGVTDCAVVGVMSDDGVTELPRAYVVRSQDGHRAAAADEIYDFVSERLVSYKRLDGGVVFVDSIPRTASGKVQRFKLLKRDVVPR
ncbi:acetyl-CoA synthetase-like protein [Thozetella sp. PMI_491]|nr:acetyl-CoA synthetase-like protein [Thozetella sp. PMI_491]